MDQLRSNLEAFGKNPRVWLKMPGYVIRNYSPDLEESVLYHMITYFIREEPVCSACKISADPLSLLEVKEWWRNTLRHNTTLIAMHENSPGADLKPITENRTRLAGVNILFVAFKDDSPPPPVDKLFFGKAARKAIQHYRNFTDKLPMFSQFDIDAVMEAAGLSVHPEERGKGLGAALLTARFEMCRELGLKVTKTVFSSAASQKIALRLGFESAVEFFYKDIVDDDGKPSFPFIPSTDRVIIATKTFDDVKYIQHTV